MQIGTKLKIVCDTREQAGYKFTDYSDVVAAIDTLTTGDYSLAGFTDLVAVERKELSDFINCLTHDRDRFLREVDRLRGYESAALVIESTIEQIRQCQYRAKVDPNTIIQSAFSLMANYRLPIYFAGTRKNGESFVYDFIRHYHRHAIKRYKALADP